VLKKTLSAPVLLLLLAGCGVSEVDIDALEKDIVSQVKDQAGVEVTADCPDQVDWKTGESFECDVEFDDGSTRQVDVKMVDDDGNVEWNLPPAAE
jgi:hypothetical protein